MEHVRLLTTEQEFQYALSMGRAVPHELAGLIVVRVAADGEPYSYWHVDGGEHAFKERRAEYPLIFKSLARAKRRMEKMAQGLARGNWCIDLASPGERVREMRPSLALWWHPDAEGADINSKWFQITGSRFPGSPKQ
jgi:hypothetical protein